ncbi:MAG: homoserine O-succinyltransferase [Caulobacterales bacterium]
MKRPAAATVLEHPGSVQVGRRGDAAGATPGAWPAGEAGRRLVVGLLNNMPDGALQATERQFTDLLREAGAELEIEVRLFCLAEVERGEHARAHMRGRYADAESIPSAGLDGLIVTGNEPRAANLADEPYWPGLTRIIDWTEAEEVPTIWSCLAAHAAVLHLDGVRRRPLAAKCSGVFAFAPTTTHPLLAGAPTPSFTPHSRLNELSEPDLAAAGYDILTRSSEAGVDSFVRRGGAPSLYFQGHPEYAADSLLREYLRDVSRFLRGERDAHPATPSGYFRAASELALEDLANRTRRRRHPNLIADYAEALDREAPAATWRPWAVRIYRNWLNLMLGGTVRLPSPPYPTSHAGSRFR